MEFLSNWLWWMFLFLSTLLFFFHCIGYHGNGRLSVKIEAYSFLGYIIT